MIVKNLKDKLLSYFESIIYNAKIGTGTTIPNESDIDLETPIVVKSVSKNTSNSVLTVTFTRVPTDTGGVLSEVGLFDDSGVCLTRYTHSPIPTSTNDNVKLYYQFKYNIR